MDARLRPGIQRHLTARIWLVDDRSNRRPFFNRHVRSPNSSRKQSLDSRAEQCRLRAEDAVDGFHRHASLGRDGRH